MKIKMTAGSTLKDAAGKVLAGPGDSVDVDDELGKSLLGHSAERVGDEPARTKKEGK